MLALIAIGTAGNNRQAQKTVLWWASERSGARRHRLTERLRGRHAKTGDGILYLQISDFRPSFPVVRCCAVFCCHTQTPSGIYIYWDKRCESVQSATTSTHRAVERGGARIKQQRVSKRMLYYTSSASEDNVARVNLFCREHAGFLYILLYW